MRFALVIILVSFAAAIFFAVVQLVLRFAGGGDVGSPFGAGVDGGAYVSRDGGVVFSQSAKVNNDVSFARFDVFAIREDRDQAGTWWVATEGAGLYRSSDQATTWETVWGDGDVLKQAVVRSLVQAPERVWLLALDAGQRGRIWKTNDDFKTFREVFSAARESVIVQALALPVQTPDVVLAGLSDGLVIGSTDNGESWTALTQFTGAVRDISFAPSDPSIVYAVVDRVGVMRSRDRGKTWEDLVNLRTPFTQDESAAQPLARFPAGRQVFSVAVHPSQPQRIYLATASGLLRSDDWGDRYVQLPVPLRPEALPVRTVAVDPVAPDTIHVTAGDGFYTSFDFGQNWRVTRFTIRPKLTQIAVSIADRHVILVGTADK